MLISKDLRKQLTVLALGSSLLAGCSSGPEMRFTRFWPGRDKPQTAQDDEAMAAKWRDRLAASETAGETNELETPNGFQVAKAEQDAEESRNGGFNLFRRFSRRNDEAKAEEKTEISDAQRAALERRIAELEAKQRALVEQRSEQRAEVTFAGTSQSSEMSDPFLASARQTAPNSPQVPIQTTKQELPAWARSDEKTAAAPMKEVAPSDVRNQFAPDFEETLRELQASADAEADTEEQAKEMEEFAEANERRIRDYPSYEPEKSPVVETNVAESTVVKNPFADAPQENPFAAKPVTPTPQPEVATTEPQLQEPIVDQEADHPLSTHKTVEEQRADYAHLEVQQLMKRSRIQARAGQFRDALATAISAEQLANSAEVEFGMREQTPAQLISLIKMKSGENQNIAAQPTQQPGHAKVIIRPTPEQKSPQVADRSEIDTNSPLPMWPGSQSTLQPKQVVDNRQPTSATRVSSRPSADNQFKTAEFLNPRPSQVTSPETTANSGDWSTHQNFNRPQSQGGFMELRPSVGRGHVRTRLVSSSNIYSPENLQWTKLDASLATIHENDPIPLPTPEEDITERPVFAEEVAEADVTFDEDDPFAGFEDAEIVETTLESDAPPTEDAPAAPVDDSKVADDQGATLFGIPAQKLGLVGLAGLILLAAIYHRRRSYAFHDA